jgi:TPR repeat protein
VGVEFWGMKNILYTIILSFLFSSSVFADFQAGVDAYDAGDYATAYKEFKILAEQGNAEAQHMLGMMYYEGKGVTQDYKEAVKWYHLAAEQGDDAAQRELSFMYRYGNGVIKDRVLAHMWINIAASNNEDLKSLRDTVEGNMTSEQITEAQKLARECIKKNYKDCG